MLRCRLVDPAVVRARAGDDAPHRDRPHDNVHRDDHDDGPAGSPTPARTVEELLHLGRPIVLAHTGGEDEFPASTMFAFGESMKAGVDMLDLNVQLTHDGILVVHHDDAVDGATDGTGKLADLDYAAIRALDDAYWFTADCVCKDRPGLGRTCTAASGPASGPLRPGTRPTTSPFPRCAS